MKGILSDHGIDLTVVYMDLSDEGVDVNKIDIADYVNEKLDKIEGK